jgi:hypothetical protein
VRGPSHPQGCQIVSKPRWVSHPWAWCGKHGSFAPVQSGRWHIHHVSGTHLDVLVWLGWGTAATTPSVGAVGVASALPWSVRTMGCQDVTLAGGILTSAPPGGVAGQ